MIHYGTRSQEVLRELHPDLKLLCLDYSDLAPPDLDIVLIDGWRSGEEQDDAKSRGASTLPAGKSKHNTRPARAFDFNVYPALPSDVAMRKLAIEYGKRVGFFIALAERRKLVIRCGIDWNVPFDPYHIELRD